MEGHRLVVAASLTSFSTDFWLLLFTHFIKTKLKKTTKPNTSREGSSKALYYFIMGFIEI